MLENWTSFRGVIQFYVVYTKGTKYSSSFKIKLVDYCSLQPVTVSHL